jgi:hypothetical protein
MEKNIIIPVYKKGDRTNPENYRGIILLNTCYKIYSILLNNKLKTFAEHFALECQNVFLEKVDHVSRVYLL